VNGTEERRKVSLETKLTRKLAETQGALIIEIDRNNELNKKLTTSVKSIAVLMDAYPYVVKECLSDELLKMLVGGKK